jgi:hypothetical protein
MLSSCEAAYRSTHPDRATGLKAETVQEPFGRPFDNCGNSW